MEKKLIVTSTRDTYETRDLVATAAKLNVPLEVINVSSLTTVATLENIASLVYWRGGSITKLFPKQVGRSTFLKSMSQAVPVINKTTLDTPHFVNKSVQQAHFSKYATAVKNILPMDTHLVTSVAEVTELIHEGRLQYPFIAKPNLGMRGEKIELITEQSDLDAIADTLGEYVLQNFVENVGDYRIFVVGGVAHDVILRTNSATSNKSYLNNISQGGTANRVADFHKRKALTRAGTAIASMFNYTVCGVDILEGVDGQLYFMEINSVPQWKGLAGQTPYPVAEHIISTMQSIVGTKEKPSIVGVRDYYLDKLKYLPVNQQFHFLSRLHLWSDCTKYYSDIANIREAWWATVPDIKKRITLIPVQTPADCLPSARQYRQAMQQKHHKVDLYNIVFFKILFDTTIFGGERAAELLPLIDIADVRAVRDALLADPEAVFTLSTLAVNFLYFCDYFFGDQDMKIDPALFIRVAEQCRLENETNHLNSLIYLYTHAVIGASHFYADPVTDHLEIYNEMLVRLERLIQDNYASTSLDHKCEFLVCCKLCNYKSGLSVMIKNEVTNSYSDQGMYIVNTHNTFSGKLTHTHMEAMEHTNVLMLMSFLDKNQI